MGKARVERHALADGYTLLVESIAYRDGRRYEFWLLNSSGQAVGFANVIDLPENELTEEPSLTLCDIEIRQGYRGLGLGRLLIDAIEKVYSVRLYFSGTFTPEGFAAFAKTAPVIRLDEEDIPSEPTVNSMGFVLSWAHRIPRFRHPCMNYGRERNSRLRDPELVSLDAALTKKTTVWATD